MAYFGLFPFPRDTGGYRFVGYGVDTDNIEDPLSLNNPTGTDQDLADLAEIAEYLASQVVARKLADYELDTDDLESPIKLLNPSGTEQDAIEIARIAEALADEVALKGLWEQP